MCFETDDVAPDHHCWQIFCDGSVGLYNDEELFQNEALRTLERLKKHKISLSKLYPSVLPCTRMLTFTTALLWHEGVGRLILCLSFNVLQLWKRYSARPDGGIPKQQERRMRQSHWRGVKFLGWTSWERKSLAGARGPSRYDRF